MLKSTMANICVICTIKDASLTPLSSEHRQIIETVVSPFINTMGLLNYNLLLCGYCMPLLQSVQEFQQTAVAGVTKLLSMTIQDEEELVEDTIKVLIKEEIEDLRPTTKEVIYAEPPEAANIEDAIKVPIKEEIEDPLLTPTTKEDIYAEPPEAANTGTLKAEIKVEADDTDSEATWSCDSEDFLALTRTTEGDYHKSNTIQNCLGNPLPPTQWGWARADDGTLKLVTINVPVAPDSILKTIFCRCKTGCGVRCGCRKAGTTCSSVCGVCSGSCTNAAPIEVTVDDDDYDNILDLEDND